MVDAFYSSLPLAGQVDSELKPQKVLFPKEKLCRVLKWMPARPIEPVMKVENVNYLLNLMNIAEHKHSTNYINYINLQRSPCRIFPLWGKIFNPNYSAGKSEK